MQRGNPSYTQLKLKHKNGFGGLAYDNSYEEIECAGDPHDAILAANAICTIALIILLLIIQAAQA